MISTSFLRTLNLKRYNDYTEKNRNKLRIYYIRTTNRLNKEARQIEKQERRKSRLPNRRTCQIENYSVAEEHHHNFEDSEEKIKNERQLERKSIVNSLKKLTKMHKFMKTGQEKMQQDRGESGKTDKTDRGHLRQRLKLVYKNGYQTKGRNTVRCNPWRRDLTADFHDSKVDCSSYLRAVSLSQQWQLQDSLLFLNFTFAGVCFDFWHVLVGDRLQFFLCVACLN